ncbi:MAG: signal peptidase I, partial [Actinobacteria bacterium]|nr:signal peptidase I [Actinomycetota bacterium]
MPGPESLDTAADGEQGPVAQPASDGDQQPGRERSSTPPKSSTAPKSSTRNVVEWVLVIVGAILVAFVVKTFFVQAFQIPSASMHPTLLEGDRVLVNKLSYRLHDINRG